MRRMRAKISRRRRNAGGREDSQSAPVRVLTLTSSIVCAHGQIACRICLRVVRRVVKCSADLSKGVDALERVEDALRHVRWRRVVKPEDKEETGRQKNKKLKGEREDAVGLAA